jgi:hypothetical protein
LTYHLLSGSHPTALISKTPEFVPSALSNTTLANVTGGQRIEASKPDEIIFQSGNKTSSTLVSGVSRARESPPLHIKTDRY